MCLKMMVGKNTQRASYPVRFMTTKKYEEVSGVTQQRVWNYIKIGKWIAGVHYIKEGRRIYVDLMQAEKWILDQSRPKRRKKV